MSFVLIFVRLKEFLLVVNLGRNLFLLREGLLGKFLIVRMFVFFKFS